MNKRNYPAHILDTQIYLISPDPKDLFTATI